MDVRWAPFLARSNLPQGWRLILRVGIAGEAAAHSVGPEQEPGQELGLELKPETSVWLM